MMSSLSFFRIGVLGPMTINPGYETSYIRKPTLRNGNVPWDEWSFDASFAAYRSFWCTFISLRYRIKCVQLCDPSVGTYRFNIGLKAESWMWIIRANNQWCLESTWPVITLEWRQALWRSNSKTQGSGRITKKNPLINLRDERGGAT